MVIQLPLDYFIGSIADSVSDFGIEAAEGFIYCGSGFL